jgi:hypothetical protein
LGQKKCKRLKQKTKKKRNEITGQWQLMPIILATWEAEMRRIKVQDQTRQILPEIPIFKITRANQLEMRLKW